MKIYYVANARMPNGKAHGIQIAKMCEAFIEAGADLTLAVPRRGMEGSIREFYRLRVEVPLERFSSLNWYNGGRLGYFLSSVSFMLTSLLFVLRKKWRGERFVIYTIDLDNYSSSLLPLAGVPLFTEMHGGKPNSLAQRFLFRRLRGVFAINSLIVEEFKKKFPHSPAEYLAEPNGVDAALFAPRDKAEARRRLGLSPEAKIALYAGRFFSWKGLEILPQAAARTPGVEWHIVGGTREEFREVARAKELPALMHFQDVVEQSEIPWWLAAADALIVLGTKRDRQSFYYTSPMKLFEYLLSKRAVVASATPAVREIVSDTEVFFYEPDSAEDLARQVLRAVLPTPERESTISRAYAAGERHSWQGRAERILAFIASHAL